MAHDDERRALTVRPDIVSVLGRIEETEGGEPVGGRELDGLGDRHVAGVQLDLAAAPQDV